MNCKFCVFCSLPLSSSLHPDMSLRTTRLHDTPNTTDEVVAPVVRKTYVEREFGPGVLQYIAERRAQRATALEAGSRRRVAQAE